jgi:Domain of unknown function (DUF397)
MGVNKPLAWHKATASATGNCVEVAAVGEDEVAVRDSKDPAGARLTFTAPEWRHFLDGVAAGEFGLESLHATPTRVNVDCKAENKDLAWRTSSFSGGDGCVDVAPLSGGGAAVRHSKDPDGPVLRFTAGEWSALLEGVRESEFDF